MKKIWILFFAFFYLENYAQELGHSLSGVQFSNTDPGFLVLKENEIMVFNSSNYYSNPEKNKAKINHLAFINTSPWELKNYFNYSEKFVEDYNEAELIDLSKSYEKDNVFYIALVSGQSEIKYLKYNLKKHHDSENKVKKIACEKAPEKCNIDFVNNQYFSTKNKERYIFDNDLFVTIEPYNGEMMSYVVWREMNDEEKLYAKAKKGNYDLYLTKYPNGKYSGELKEKKSYVEQQSNLFIKSNKTELDNNDLFDYKDFLLYYPENPLYEPILTRLSNNPKKIEDLIKYSNFFNEPFLDNILEDKVYKIVSSSGDVNLYDKYLENFPNGKHVAQIKESYPKTKMVKNYYYSNDVIINNNIVIKNIWEKMKNSTSKDLFTGRVLSHMSHRYNGSIDVTTGLPEGNGTLIIGMPYPGFNTITGTGIQVYYEGEWQNGIFNGQGRLVNKYQADYVELYNGSWKNGLYHGAGTLMETKLNDKIEFIQYTGNFIDGKKNGKMSVIGQYKDQLSNGFYIKDITQALYQKFRFSAEAEYDNDVLVKYNLIEDHEKHLNQYFAQIVKNRQESAERWKTEKCIKCEINYKKSTYPREDNNFWSGKGHVNGKLIMKNGDEYNFDFQNGKSKILKGWFETDDYYPTFKAMVVDLEKKCLEKYCQ